MSSGDPGHLPGCPAPSLLALLGWAMLALCRLGVWLVLAPLSFLSSGAPGPASIARLASSPQPLSLRGSCFLSPIPTSAPPAHLESCLPA